MGGGLFVILNYINKVILFIIFMDTKSIFSVNTNLTNFKSIPNPNVQSAENQIHYFYYKLLPTFSMESPHLSKLFYLQLLVRENILIFTTDRVDARDIWLSISRMLDLKKPEIYVIDEKFNVNQILTTKNQYQRVLLYDVSKLSVENINKLLNSEMQISLVGIEENNSSIGSHVVDFFSMLILHKQQKHAFNLMDTFNQHNQIQSARQFDKKGFNEAVKLNFEVVLKQSEQQGFIKPFLELFERNIRENNIKVSQSRWKKMLRILKFVATNKNEGVYKKMSLGDFIISPELLASSTEELRIITEILQKCLIIFTPYYGIQKFEKSIKNHFWFSQEQQAKAIGILDELNKNSISFFYPCSKFPDTASLKACQEKDWVCYQIRGFEKKLLSDHHYQVQTDQEYHLEISVRAKCRMLVHLGVTCYNKLKTVISPVQACRNEDTAVIFLRLEDDKIIVANEEKLAKWENSKDNYSFQRAIGVYFNGDTSDVPPLNQIIYNQKQAYSKVKRPYDAIQINKQKSQGTIMVSNETKQWLASNRHLLQKNKSKLMNHFEGGVGCIGQSIWLQKTQEWRKVQIKYRGSEFRNSGQNFFPGTKYVRISLMVNFSEGDSNMEIENKNGIFEFRQIKFRKKQ